MKGNIYEEYLNYRTDMVVKYFSILLKDTFHDKEDYVSYYGDCVKYYISNFILNNKELDSNVIDFCLKNKIFDDIQRKSVESMLKTFLKIEYVLENEYALSFLNYYSKVMVIALMIDEKTNSIVGENVNFTSLYAELRKKTNELDCDELLDVLRDYKDSIAKSVKKDYLNTKKVVHLLGEQEFLLNLHPIIDNETKEEVMYLAKMTYEIPTLKKYAIAECNNIATRGNTSFELFFVLINLCINFKLKLIVKGKRDIVLFVELPTLLLKSKKYINLLMKYAKTGWLNNIIFKLSNADMRDFKSNINALSKCGIVFWADYNVKILDSKLTFIKYLFSYEMRTKQAVALQYNCNVNGYNIVFPDFGSETPAKIKYINKKCPDKLENNVLS